MTSSTVLTLPSETGRHRALVVKLSPKLFRVEIERLIEDYDAGGSYRGEFWSRIWGWSSYTDSFERAAELAAENLRNAAVNN